MLAEALGHVGHLVAGQLGNRLYPLAYSIGYRAIRRFDRDHLTGDPPPTTFSELLASGAIALLIYWLYPVAPPRELPELAAQFDAAAPAYILGFFDTMEQYLGYAYDTQSTRAFVNPYAAMPSLHFGWDLLLGIAIIAAFRRTALAWLAMAIGIGLPLLQIFAITTTANHYLIDAVAGGIVAIAGLGVALALRRWGYPWLVEQIRKLPWPSARRLLLGDAA